MSRRKILIGNWKLNHDKKTAAEFFEIVFKDLGQGLDIDLAIAPVAPMLDIVGQMIAGRDLSLAAQNVFYEPNGAYTGEWSAKHLVDCGVKYCLVGHSERRKLFHESDDDVGKKVAACLKALIAPVICVGESEPERDQHQVKEVIRRQVESALARVQADLFAQVIFAYEPIWAIGTGKAACATDAQQIHKYIREIIAEIFGRKTAEKTRILYGGSVSSNNIGDFTIMPDIDGALVGGASLQARAFLTMVEKLRED